MIAGRHHGLGPRRHWYERFGIEPPFPWVYFLLRAIPVLLVVAGASVVLWHHY